MKPKIENNPLAGKIWRRYSIKPGVISGSVASGILARTAAFGTNRLPLLQDISRRWPTTVNMLHSDRSSLVHARFHAGSPTVEKLPPRIVSGRPTGSIGERRTGTNIPGVQTKADPVIRSRSQETMFTGSAKIMTTSIDPDGSTFSSLPAAEEPRRSTSGDKARSVGILRKPPGSGTTVKSADSGLPAQQLQSPSAPNDVGAPLINRNAAKEPHVDLAAATKTGPGGQQTRQRDSVNKIPPKPGYQNSDLISLSPSGKVATAGQSAIAPDKKKSSPQAGPTSSTIMPLKTSVQWQLIPVSNQGQDQASGTGARPHVFGNQESKTGKDTAVHPVSEIQSKETPDAPEKIRRSPTEGLGGKTDDLPGGTRADLSPSPPEQPAGETVPRHTALTGGNNLGIQRIERHMSTATVSHHPAAAVNTNGQNIRDFRSHGMDGRTIHTQDHRMQFSIRQAAGAPFVDHPFGTRRPGGSGVTGSSATDNPSGGRRNAALPAQASPVSGFVAEQLAAEKKDLSGPPILASDPVTASTGGKPLFLKADSGLGMLIAGRLPHATAAHRSVPSRESTEAFESQGNSGALERIFKASFNGGDLSTNLSPALGAAKYTNTASQFESQPRGQVLRSTIQKSGSGFQFRRHADPMFPAGFATITHQTAIGGGSKPNPTAGVYRWPSTLPQAAGDLIHLTAAGGTPMASASDSQSSSTSPESAMNEGPGPEISPGSESIDIERLADEVYDLIERRLIIERERLGL